MNVQPRPIADFACNTGEGPMWHPMEQKLYWTDIPNGKLFRYDPNTGQSEQVYQGRPVGGFTMQEDGSLLLFMDRGTVAIWKDGQLRTVIEEIPEERETRFNDVEADPLGGVFCGTMPAGDKPASLYRLAPDGSIQKILADVGLANGMGFSVDARRLYFTDTHKRQILRFDFDGSNGSLSNQTVFAHVGEDVQGAPDGLCVDGEDHVWSAHWGGACVIRYSPDGQEVSRIEFPVPKTSCPQFGGPEYDKLFVTTAGGQQRDKDGPLAGALFECTPGVLGKPEFFSRILL